MNVEDYEYVNENELVTEKFIHFFPNYAKNATGYRYIGDGESIFYMRDKSKVIFDELNNSATYIPPRENNVSTLTEEEWKHEFSRKMKRKLMMKGISVRELSEQAGVSYRSLYKYLREETIPSAYAVDSISEALGCKVSELIYFNYLF